MGRMLGVFVVSVLGFATLAGGKSNLLLNPSFEEVMERNSAMPQDWTVLKKLSFDKHHFLDMSTSIDGNFSLKIENKVAATKKAVLIWMQKSIGERLVKSCPPGTEMELSVYVRTDSPKTKARIYFESMSAHKTFLKSVSNLHKGEWRRVVVRFKITDSNFSRAYICLQLVGNGAVWFDDAYLGPVAGAPKKPATVLKSVNRINNGSFEKSAKKTGEPIAWKIKRTCDGTCGIDISKAKKGKSSLKFSFDGKSFPAGGVLSATQDGIEKELLDCPSGTEMELSLWANAAGDPSVKFKFVLKLSSDGKSVGIYDSGLQDSYAGWKKIHLRFKMPKGNPDKALLVLSLQTSGAVWLDEVKLVVLKHIDKTKREIAVSDYCRVSDFPPRHTYVTPSKPGKLSLEYALPKSSGGKLAATLSNAMTGEKIKEFTFSNLPLTGNGNASIDLSSLTLPPGAYRLLFESGSGDAKMSNERFFRIRKLQRKGVRFFADNRMLLDGKPFFPIVYWGPEPVPDALRVYKKAGFNTIVVGNFLGSKIMMKYHNKHLRKYNFAVVCRGNFAYHNNLPDPVLTKKLKTYVENAREVPRFIGWADDEVEWAKLPFENVQRIYRNIFKYAPDYIYWQNHAPRVTAAKGQPWHTLENVRRYSLKSNVTGVDIYPVPERRGHNNLDDISINCVGKYTDILSKLVYGQKPVWMVLQGFGWGDFNKKLKPGSTRPNYSQLRFMVYNAITHGSTGIVMFRNSSTYLYEPFMATMADVMKELNAFSPILAAGKIDHPKYSGAGEEVRVESWSLKNDFLIVAVNETKKEKNILVDLPSNAGKLYSSPNGDALAIEDGRVRVKLESNGVAVFSTKRVVIPKTKLFKPQQPEPEDLTQPGAHQAKVLMNAEWVAHPDFPKAPDKTTYARHQFKLDKIPEEARLRMSVDDECKVWLNGYLIAVLEGHSVVNQFDVRKYLRKGENTFNFELYNHFGPSGFVFELMLRNGKKQKIIVSGDGTRFSENGKDDWVPAFAQGKPPAKPWRAPRLLIVN